MATMTAAQQRARAKTGYDAFLAVCPSRRLLDRLSDKWVVLVLAALGADGSDQVDPRCAGGSRSMRYSELARLLAGVSQKMLTQTLRSLERDGLLTRTVVATVPVTVIYQLTDLGLSLHHTVRGLKTWARRTWTTSSPTAPPTTTAPPTPPSTTPSPAPERHSAIAVGPVDRRCPEHPPSGALTP